MDGRAVITRPPCWPSNGPCPNRSASQHYRRVIYNETALNGPWIGWRLIGARLVSPHWEWIAAHTLDRWLWRESRLYRDT